MKYVGSKNRISKYIAPIIQKYIDNNNITVYYEPFCGGLNMMDKIKCKTRIGNDSHYYLIEMWKALQRGWMPPEHISEEYYNDVRTHMGKYPPHEVGLVGFNATFGAKWFGGYARGFKADKVTPRDIPNEAIRNLKAQIPLIKDVKLVYGDYSNNEYSDIKNAVIYCDPPYQNTTKYSTSEFDYDKFWNWCRKMSKNNIVLISEYNAPDDFKCIWSKSVTTSLKVHEHENRVEKLFIYNT